MKKPQIEQPRDTIPVMAAKAIAIAVLFWFFTTQVENHGEPPWIAGLLCWVLVDAGAKGVRALSRGYLRLTASLGRLARMLAGVRSLPTPAPASRHMVRAAVEHSPQPFHYRPTKS